MRLESVVKVVAVINIVLFIFLGASAKAFQNSKSNEIKVMDLSQYSLKKPGKKINLLFIHHSCGATLLADKGNTKIGKYCLWICHPNGGGLRKLLEKNNYTVHEATYGSKIGQKTDINDWHKKFRDCMDIILRTDHQDRLYNDGSVNQVIVFKSCYPNNNIIADCTPPGDPDSPKRTLWNCKAAYNSLLPIFRKYPNTLFVAMTAPPIAKPRSGSNFCGRSCKDTNKEGPDEIAARARRFNNWLKDIGTGWLSKYKGRNVVVFDYYDILTGKGVSNWSQYPTRNGTNSHPNSEGNQLAAKEFIIFLNRAVRYAGIAD